MNSSDRLHIFQLSPFLASVFISFLFSLLIQRVQRLHQRRQLSRRHTHLHSILISITPNFINLVLAFFTATPPFLATFFSISLCLNMSVPKGSVTSERALNLAQVNFIYEVKNSFYVLGDAETWMIGYAVVGCFYSLLSGETHCPAPK